MEYKRCNYCEAIFDFVDMPGAGYVLKQRRSRKKTTYPASKDICPACKRGTLITTTPDDERWRAEKEQEAFRRIEAEAKRSGESVVGLKQRALHGNAPTLLDRYKARQ